MLQLQNKTPFSANISILPNIHGEDTLFVIVSARFKLSTQLLLDDKQPMPTEADEYTGEPGFSSIARPSEYHLGKLATDIIVLGDACAPEGHQVRELEASIQVADLYKSVRVYGDRVWKNGNISLAEPFERMPITYERAYGGAYFNESNELVSSEIRNPVGRGYMDELSKGQIEQSLLPNIENSEELIQAPSDCPQPAGFGVIGPNWSPRVDYAGTYDSNWAEMRAPYLPLDFDHRFFNCASPGLIYLGYIRGGEPVVISGMHPKGPLQFALPKINLLARASINGQLIPMAFNIETLVLEPNELALTITWRSQVPIGKALHKVTGVEVVMARQVEEA